MDSDERAESENPPSDSVSAAALEPVAPEELESAAGAPPVAEAEAAPPAAVPPAAPGPDLAALERRLDELRDIIEEGNRIARDRERVIDRLYEENQKLRAGELTQALDPVWRDLMRLHDDLERTFQAYAARPEIDPEAVRRDWASYAEVVADILYRQGIEQLEIPPEAPFNPREHRACAAVPTPEAARDRTVARVVRAGFRNAARILRVADVEVCRFTPEESAGPPAPCESP